MILGSEEEEVMILGNIRYITATPVKTPKRCDNRTCGEPANWAIALVRTDNSIKTRHACPKCLTSAFSQIRHGE